MSTRQDNYDAALQRIDATLRIDAANWALETQADRDAERATITAAIAGNPGNDEEIASRIAEQAGEDFQVFLDILDAAETLTGL